MLPGKLEDVNQGLIERLCADKCPESQLLEFKRELPARTLDGRAELAKDVCAFANAGGGDLVYGVADANACAAQPMPISSEKSDAARRRMQDILDARLEPRVLGLQFHEFKLGDGYGLVLRVPASFNGPHRYVDDNQYSRFVVRSGTRIAELTYQELRGAFDRTATLFERARQFRAERLALIAAGRTSRQIYGPPCVIHLIPLMAMDGRSRIDIEPMYYDHQKFARFRYNGWGGAPLSRSVNLDGLFVGAGIERVAAYVQVFRTGAFEAVECVGWESDKGQKLISATNVCWFVRDSVEILLAAARDFGLVGPAAFCVGLLGTGPYQFEPVRQLLGGRPAPAADRPDLIIPERWIDRLEDPGGVDEIARPMLDLVYQCFNMPACEAYGQDGDWTLQRC